MGVMRYFPQQLQQYFKAFYLAARYFPIKVFLTIALSV